MFTTPALTDPAILALAIIFVIVIILALVTAIALFRRAEPWPDTAIDPRHLEPIRPARLDIGDDHHHLVAPRTRPAWFAGTIIALALLTLSGWLQQRDEAAARAEARDQRLRQQLARARCPAPAAPLEKLVGPVASQSDRLPLTVACVYVTGDLGVIPRLRYTPAHIAEAAPQ